MTDPGDVLAGIHRLTDFEPLARAAMDPGAYDFVAGGAWDEITLEENVASWRRRRFRPRTLIDVSGTDPSTSLLGMPTRLCASLRRTSLALRDAVAANDAAAVRQAQAALSALRAEGTAAWDSWQDSDALVDAAPDLVVPKDMPRHGN